jgi:hypothetical protein
LLAGCRCRAAKQRNRGNRGYGASHHYARLYYFVIAAWRAKKAKSVAVKYWEIIAKFQAAAVPGITFRRS